MDSILENIKAVFFDLDGTLLGLSDEDFEKIYTKLVVKRFDDIIEPDIFIKALWKGTEDMLRHDDNSKLVLDSFFDSFCDLTGLSKDETYRRFNLFYENEFDQLQNINEPVPEARKIIDLLKEKNIKIILATNPVFPEIATRKRCAWTNLDYDEFLYVSHAENSYACKPSKNYYHRLLEIAEVKPEETLMVGNDYLFDIGATMFGMKTWMIDKFQSNLEYKEKFVPDFTGSLNELLEIISD